MNFVLQPWQLLLIALAGWINRQQQDVVDYLRTENQILKQAHGKRRIRLTDDQRRRLAVKGKILGRKALGEICTIVTPDTILRWHRTLVARKWDYSHRRKNAGRPRVSRTVVDFVMRMARENPTSGYDRIQGALANLGHEISDTTVGNILREHGIEPAPERKRHSTWKAFIKAHWDVLAAVDFTTIANLNAHMERFMRSLKDECLRRMIFFGETSLRKATSQFVDHYHRERNHQGLANRLIEPGDEVGDGREQVRCRERLGGLLKYYYGDAA